MRFKAFLFLLPISLFSATGYVEPWGRDSDIRLPAPSSTPPLDSLPAAAAKKIILFHQRVLSPVDGPRSHFFPCSSRYMKAAITEHGFIKGFLMGCDRLLRENTDDWVYRNIVIDDRLVKYDPPRTLSLPKNPLPLLSEK